MGGLLNVLDFYAGTCRPNGPRYGWYVRRLRGKIEGAYVDGGGGERDLLVGHLTGGWFARVALGDGSWGTASTSASKGEGGAVRAAKKHKKGLGG